MSLTIELTDEDVKQLRQWRTGGYHQGMYDFLARLVAQLPPETVDPRELPPGPKLNRLVCAAMHLCYIPETCLRQWSDTRVYVGEMLGWLYEQGYHYIAFYDREVGTESFLGLQIRQDSSPDTVIIVYGETPQHALARAVAIVGGQHD